MTENEKARELIATSETTVKVDPQNGWYLKRFAALQFEDTLTPVERLFLWTEYKNPNPIETKKK